MRIPLKNTYSVEHRLCRLSEAWYARIFIRKGERERERENGIEKMELLYKFVSDERNLIWSLIWKSCHRAFYPLCSKDCMFVTKVGTRCTINILTFAVRMREGHYGLLQLAKRINPRSIAYRRRAYSRFFVPLYEYIGGTPRPPAITQKSRALDQLSRLFDNCSKREEEGEVEIASWICKRLPDFSMRAIL